MTPERLLNRHCHCRTLDRERLDRELAGVLRAQGLPDSIAALRPTLFSSTLVFLSQDSVDRMAEAIRAIERVTRLAPYRHAALARAPRIASSPRETAGVFMGYDFHIDAAGPKLIEINTNAGGALLNLALVRAQQACCEALSPAVAQDRFRAADEAEIWRMFQTEWRRERGERPLRHLLIVDDEPDRQYLLPEFALFRQLFMQQGVRADIADPRELEWTGTGLSYQGSEVDMVYNRLTDFYLAEAAHRPLAQAWSAGAVVMTPHPRAHALHADKANLVALSDDGLLAGWGVSPSDRQTLSDCIPATTLVTPDKAAALWAARRGLFFKPVAGFAGRGAYRGDKLTRRVWDDIVRGGYVAQELVRPGERSVQTDGQVAELKFDVRAYTYDGVIQTLAARTYEGQTTNFRTAGGGFSPVTIVQEGLACAP